MVPVASGQRGVGRFRSYTGTVFIIFFFFIVFIFAVYWFRSKPTAPQETGNSIADVFTPDPIARELIEGAIDTQSKDATLRWVATQEIIGQARRGEKDARYYLELKTRLPEIDREKFYYQVWLLRRLPYDFFSLGEMITDEEGNFIFEWHAPESKDYSDFTEIIITMNEYGRSADPGVHLVEGKFGD